MVFTSSARRLALLLITFALTTAGRGAVSVATSYTENFDALGTALPDGWEVWTSSTTTGNGAAFSWSSVPATPTANNAAAATDTFFRNLPGASQSWSAGLSTGSDRALGWRAGNAASRDGSITFTWLNTSGWTFSDLSFDLFTPNSSGTAATFNLEYQIGATGTFTSFVGASYTTVPTPASSPSALGVTTLQLTAAELSVLNDHSGLVTLRLNTAATSTTLNTLALDNFHYTATSATAVPEPATFALFGGLVVLGLALTRRSRPCQEKSAIRPLPRP